MMSVPADRNRIKWIEFPAGSGRRREEGGHGGRHDLEVEEELIKRGPYCSRTGGVTRHDAGRRRI